MYVTIDNEKIASYLVADLVLGVRYTFVILQWLR